MMKFVLEAPHYLVTEQGRVYSAPRKGAQGGGYMKQGTNKDGYPKISLMAGGKKLYRKVHRLVAQAFIPNPENKPCVNHKDGDKANNHVSNLEWCTFKENTQHAWDNGMCTAYDRTQPYNRQAIIDSNRTRIRVKS